MRRLPISVLALCAIVWASSYAAEQAPTTKAPGLSEAERASMATMTREQLAAVVRTGDYAHVSAAVPQLMQTGGVAENFGLLLSIAKDSKETFRGDIIVEYMVPHASADGAAESKARVDAYVAFLEQQLRDPAAGAVTPAQAVRSLARTVYWNAAAHPGIPGQPRPAPGYPYRHVVNDLLGLLKDKRPLVQDAAVSWLGNVGGYAAEQSREVIAALGTYRRGVAAQPAGSEKAKERQEMRLAQTDRAIQDVIREQQRRAEAAARPASPTTPGTPVPDK
jgi:hypothetical protein